MQTDPTLSTGTPSFSMFATVPGTQIDAKQAVGAPHAPFNYFFQTEKKAREGGYIFLGVFFGPPNGKSPQGT